MSDISRYGALESAGGSGAQTADALVGQHVGAGGTAQQVDSRFSPAMHSTAPYKPPQTASEKASQKAHESSKLCLKEGCRQWHKLNSDYCRWHQP